MIRSAVAPGVVVLGPHRSGTSAVTGALSALGLHPCPSQDRMPVRRWNARGNFESRSISQFDERLLNRLGGAWWAPPAPMPGWASAPGLAALKQEAAQLFAAAHPSSPWVWKDPRASTVMPFWDEVLGPNTPRVIVLRHPVETANSLHERNSMPIEHGVALAERCLRCSLRDSAGHPVLITTYDQLLKETSIWSETAAKFLENQCGLVPLAPAFEQLLDFLDDSLRHHRAGGGATASDEVPPSFKPLWAWASARTGAHGSLSVDSLPDESEETAGVMAAATDSLGVAQASKSFGSRDVSTGEEPDESG